MHGTPRSYGRGVFTKAPRTMTPRQTLERLYAAAVAAADPYTTTREALRGISLGTRAWIIAIGKGAHAMARGAVEALTDMHRTPVGGVVVAPNEDAPWDLPLAHTAGDHPVPGARSFSAAAHVGDIVHLVRPGDDVIVLLSGGTSSLVAAPVEGISQEALVALFDALLRSGAPIETMNAFRRRVLRWGGGRLAQALRGARFTVLVASDVVGGSLEAIGSGPCAPDPLRAADLVELAARHRLTPSLPQEVRDYLDESLNGLRPETPKSTDAAFALVSTRIILDNRVAVDGLVATARQLGIREVHVAPNPILGGARSAGEAIARAAIAARAGAPPHASSGDTLFVWGGETTVRLGSNSGLGGRSQELALAAAEVLHLAGDAGAGVSILAAGTDGRDGPTDAAGAIVDATTWGKILASGRDATSDLEQHDSYHALDAAGALLRPGLTGTNVNDIVAALV